MKICYFLILATFVCVSLYVNDVLAIVIDTKTIGHLAVLGAPIAGGYATAITGGAIGALLTGGVLAHTGVPPIPGISLKIGGTHGTVPLGLHGGNIGIKLGGGFGGHGGHGFDAWRR